MILVLHASPMSVFHQVSSHCYLLVGRSYQLLFDLRDPVSTFVW
jgi:hypothetical protein